jgi:tetratricopeptide (TPR) repeat protein
MLTSRSNAAVLRAKRGEYDAAEALLRAALRLFPAHDRILVKLADLLQDERGDEDAARRSRMLTYASTHA